MTMPSDIEPDVTEAMERTVRPGRPATGGPGSEEIGWVVALLAAFFGVVYAGPALARWRRRPPLKQRLARRAEALRRDARRRAQAAGGRLRRRARRLGGGRL